MTEKPNISEYIKKESDLFKKTLDRDFSKIPNCAKFLSDKNKIVSTNIIQYEKDVIDIANNIKFLLKNGRNKAIKIIKDNAIKTNNINLLSIIEYSEKQYEREYNQKKIMKAEQHLLQVAFFFKDIRKQDEQKCREEIRFLYKQGEIERLETIKEISMGKNKPIFNTLISEEYVIKEVAKELRKLMDYVNINRRNNALSALGSSLNKEKDDLFVLLD